MADKPKPEQAQKCGIPASGKRVIGRPFKPGAEWTGNAGGRPKKKWLTELAEELLEEICSDDSQRQEFKAALKGKLLSKGVVSAMTLDKMWERTEGKVPQDLNLGGEVTLNLADAISQARKRAAKCEE